ncbi:hypothetical protein, partial [Streptomyces sp. NPDC002133]|uniref:hypothetical protein n=1 Tax=Streptomyces sp. NPDC002133 TaxID=3154409 RepID=UPI0033196A91
HAVGRIADITADKHMEGVRLTRWLLSPWGINAPIEFRLSAEFRRNSPVGEFEAVWDKPLRGLL